jgi:hypothetical protein
MKAEYLERYDELNTLRPGDVAVSKDRGKLFLCLWVPNADGTDCHVAIVDLDNPCHQYVHKLDLNQPVRKLAIGDKFLITV